MTLLNILFILFVIVITIQCVYYGFLFSKFALAKPENPSQKNIGISVLVCAKNEATNLQKSIPLLLEQDYSQFEIILINDNSSDDSLKVMQSFQSNHNTIKVIDVQPNEAFWGSKKYALTLGIKASKYNFLLLTDADCVPYSNQWIKEMSRHFTNTKTIVLGFGAYRKIKHSFLNLLIRFETTFTAMQYFSYALAGQTYMAVGRNLAYRKDEFFNSNGFTKHMQIKSGDDDLFVNEAATSMNTTICFAKDSFTISEPETTFKSWFQQKRRHVSTSHFYKLNHKLLLGLFYISQLSFWTLACILLSTHYQLTTVIILIMIRLLFVFFSYGLSAKKLNAIDTIVLLPLLELFLVLMQLVIFSSNLFTKSHHWK